MGTWGPGSFDNDTAADGLADLTGKVVAQVTAAFAGDDTALEPDEFTGAMVTAWLDVLVLLDAQGWPGAMMPAESDLIGWRERFLRIWGDTIDGLGPSEQYRTARRVAIEQSFDAAIASAHRREG
jgi:hypothetical protein